MNPMSGKWGYSNDEEMYHGCFDTAEEAMAEATDLGYRVIGEYREPDAPEYYVEADMILEHIIIQRCTITTLARYCRQSSF